MSLDTLGLVESPAQFLHLIEWCYAEGAADRTRAVVLAPRQPHALAQLRELAGFAAEEGLAVDWLEPRASAAAFAGAVRRLRPSVVAARRLVIGDPFSGLIQTLLPAVRAQQVVVVDDGTATMEFAAQYAGRGALRRWDSRPSPLDLPRAVLGHQARRVLAGAQLRLFTVMPIVGVPASRLQANRYSWLHGRFAPPRVVGGVDVIGSSLVESGVADRSAYLNRVVGHRPGVRGAGTLLRPPPRGSRQAGRAQPGQRAAGGPSAAAGGDRTAPRADRAPGGQLPVLGRLHPPGGTGWAADRLPVRGGTRGDARRRGQPARKRVPGEGLDRPACCPALGAGSGSAHCFGVKTGRSPSKVIRQPMPCAPI